MLALWKREMLMLDSLANQHCIRPATWAGLIDVNSKAVQRGPAEPGVFATAVGPSYSIGGPRSIFYVGKSAGPLGERVGLTNDQAASTRASTDWMVTRRNLSAFWQMIDKLDRSRLSLAWSNGRRWMA